MRRIPIAALAVATVILTGCSTASGSQIDRPTRAPAAAQTPSRAGECAVDVSKALVGYWGVMSGRSTVAEHQSVMTPFVASHQGDPEMDFYYKYAARGVTVFSAARNAGEDTSNMPADLIFKFGKDIRKECEAVYSD